MSGPCTDCGGPDYQTLLARLAEAEAENARWNRSFARWHDDLANIDKLKQRAERAEAALAERDAQWAELRRQMQVTTKAGIDIYVRGNAEDFIGMMDSARAEEGSG